MKTDNSSNIIIIIYLLHIKYSTKHTYTHHTSTVNKYKQPIQSSKIKAVRLTKAG